MILSVLAALDAFGQDEGEGESAPLPVCFNMNDANADAVADDLCFPPVEGYERFTTSSDGTMFPAALDLPGDSGFWPGGEGYELLNRLTLVRRRGEGEFGERYHPELGSYDRTDWWGIWHLDVIYYAPQDPTGRAMVVRVLRVNHLPASSRSKFRYTDGISAVRQTIVGAELLTESHDGGSEAPRTLPYNTLLRTDTGTLVVEDCDHNTYAYDSTADTDYGAHYPYAVVLGEGDDLRNVDRMIRRYLVRMANPAVCTSFCTGPANAILCPAS